LLELFTVEHRLGLRKAVALRIRRGELVDSLQPSLVPYLFKPALRDIVRRLRHGHPPAVKGESPGRAGYGCWTIGICVASWISISITSRRSSWKNSAVF